MRIDLHPEHDSVVLRGRSVRGSGPLPAAPPGSATPDPALIVDTLVAVVKITFTADGGTAAPAPDQRPLERTDVLLPDAASNDRMWIEHDLAVVKPRADVVVLGSPREPVNAPEGGTLREPWTEAVAVGAQRMEGQFTTAPDPDWGGPPPYTFGWEPRNEGVRNGYAGSYGDDGAFDPDDGLPVGFRNRFFNGGRYTAGRPAFTHLPAGAVVAVSTAGTYDMGGGGEEASRLEPPDLVELHLPPTAPSAVVTYRDDGGATTEVPVPMVADTLVFHRDDRWFTVTWRGSWDFGAVPAERYVGVTIRGGP